MRGEEKGERREGTKGKRREREGEREGKAY